MASLLTLLMPMSKTELKVLQSVTHKANPYCSVANFCEHMQTLNPISNLQVLNFTRSVCVHIIVYL